MVMMVIIDLINNGSELAVKRARCFFLFWLGGAG